ncbi:cI-like repressor [Streptococcus pyogenes]|nr:cI-like repressor [Streptococcus pyogenes]
MVKINEILSQYNIKLFEFPEAMWDRKGFYYPDKRIIYINQNLSQIEKKKLFYTS